MTGEYYLGINNKAEVDFYVIKGVVEELLDYLGYSNRYSFVTDKPIPSEFHPGQTALINVNNDIVGYIGRVHPNVCKDKVFVFEINLSKLLTKKVGKMKFKEISKFPNVKKDVAFIVDKNITSKEIEMVIKKASGSSLTNIEVFDVYTGENVGENEKSIAYSLTFLDSKKTLTDEEVMNAFNKVISRMVPFMNSPKNDFYKLFNSFEAVPLAYREEYLDKIYNKKFYDAMGYCLSISKGQYYKMKKEDNIEEINGDYFINVKYDSELGLLLSDEESTFM